MHKLKIKNMNKKLLSFILVSLFLGFNVVYAKNNGQAQSALAKVNHQFFIENKGQWPNEVLYLTRINGLDAWITKKGVLYTFYKLEENKNEDKKEGIILGHRVWMKLQNQNQNVSPEVKEKQAAYYNYFLGNDPNKHVTNVSIYNQALVKNVYNGIDVRYYFDNGNLRYDYIVKPEANPSQIKFSLEGSSKTFLNKNGNITFTTRFGEVQLAELKTYQQNNNRVIASKFSASKEETNRQSWGITLAPYDHSQTLIIDPLIYSTYIGGANAEQGFSIAIDASGNTYITGKTGSADYDVTAGVFQTTQAAANDAFVTKLNATGTALVYSTYIGGSGFDQGSSIAIGGTNLAYITGATGSTNYPTTAGVFQSTKVGTGNDAFVIKLNATGTALVYSTYIGGRTDDAGNSITIGTLGNACITGQTNSTDYDITAGAFQTVKDVNYDVFVTRLNAGGTALIYSTFIGGGSADYGHSISIDGTGNTYITGYTASSDYDITAGAFQTTKGGLDDAFVTKLNATGTALLYSTYIGGTTIDRANAIAIDGSGNAYITGSAGNFYNTTAGAFQTGQQGGNDAFVTKLNPSGTALVYSTYIGGSLEDCSNSIAVDGNGNAYITGYTYSTNYDIIAGAFQTTHVGTDDDVFVTILNASGTSLLYSTYIGGSALDAGNSISIDGIGNAYITGFTFSSNYDITAGAFQTVYGAGGFDDVFVSKLCLTGSTLSSVLNTNNQTVCANTPIVNITYATFGSTGIGAATGLPTGVIANWSGGTITISGTPTAGGTFNYTIPLTGGCGTGSATGTITVISTPVSPAFASVSPICSGVVLATLPTTSTNGVTGTWSPAINNMATTTYTFTPAAGQCATTSTMTITVTPTVTPTFVLVDTICSGSTLAPLPTTSTNGITGTWSPAINNTASTNYYFTPTAGQCVTNTTISHAIWVNSTTVTPAFFAVNPICSGAALAALPTISTNSITGTWSPAINNMATTTYTFTPAAAECTTTTTTLSITVNPTDIASISYANTAFCVTANDAPCNITGVTGGTFSSLPVGLTLGIATGLIGVSTSSSNTYTVSYITAGTCPVTTSTTVSIDLCTGIHESFGDYIKVYPNPASTYISIDNSNIEINQIRLTNILGETVVIKNTTSNKTTINLEQLPIGIYFIKLYNPNGEIVYTQKISVNE